MKKLISLLLVAVLMLFVCPFAFAEGSHDRDWCPVLEGGLPEYSLPSIPEEERKGLLTANSLTLDAWAAGHLDIRIEERGDFFDSGLTWSVSAEGGKRRLFVWVFRCERERGKRNTELLSGSERQTGGHQL